MLTGAEQNNELVHVKVTTCFMARLDMYRWLFFGDATGIQRPGMA
jgi:hypothetical protein